MEKITKHDRFMELRVLAVEAENEELVAFIDNEIALLEKKRNADRKPTATQKANVEYKAMILDFLATVGRPVSIKEVQTGIPVFVEKEFSNQKVSRLLSDLYNKGLPERKVDKMMIDKVVHYTIKADA